MTETQLAPIAKKLSALIRLLSSDHDGEVLAAGRAIPRLLASAKLDVHVLGDAVEAAARKQFSEEDALEIYQRGVAKGKQDEQNARPATFHSVGNKWLDMAEECAAHRPLRPNEVEFVEHRVRFAECGCELSEKQAHWLRAIYARRPK